MSFAKAYSGMKGAAARALILGVCSLGLAGCETLSSLNPFEKDTSYKPEIVSNAPAASKGSAARRRHSCQPASKHRSKKP